MTLTIFLRCYKCKRGADQAQMRQEHWYEPVYFRHKDGMEQSQLCPKCAPKLSFRRWARRFQWRVRHLSNILGPSRLGWCYRCKTTWNFVEGHTTDYSEGAGCFPLCERCWEELSPIQRLPYYRQLWELWLKDFPLECNGVPMIIIWEQLKRAVEAGK